MSELMSVKPICYGIDLGTTNSCIACYCKVPERYRFDNPEIIPNIKGERLTPSAVCFQDRQVIIGADALKIDNKTNVKNIFYSVKRLIGTPFKDKNVESDSRYYSYNIYEKNGKPVFHVQTERFYREEDGKRLPIEIDPVQVSALVLQNLKSQGDEKYKDKINNVVITVPANFNKVQRESVKAAARIADLTPVDVISEPIAATIAYASKLGISDEVRNVFIFDFGGGTLDVSVVRIKNRNFSVLSTAGDGHFGGSDIDQYLMEKQMDEIKQRKKIDLVNPDDSKKEEYQRVKRNLQSECEKAKKYLSANIEATNINIIINGESYESVITRNDIQIYLTDNQSRILDPIDSAINSAGLKIEDFTSVIVIGGSSNIPFIQDMIKEKFKIEALQTPIEPDSAVSKGASIYGAHKLSGGEKFIITDVTPNTIKLNLRSRKLKGKKRIKPLWTLVKGNSPIPCKSEWVRCIAPSNGNITLSLSESADFSENKSTKVGSCSFKISEATSKRGVWIRISLDKDSNITGQLSEKEEIPKDDDGVEESKVLIKKAFTESEINTMKNDNKSFLMEYKSSTDEEVIYHEKFNSELNNIKKTKKLKSLTGDKMLQKRIKDKIDEIKKEIKGKYDDDNEMSQRDYNELKSKIEIEIREILDDDSADIFS